MDPNNALALAGSGMVAAGMLIRLLIDLSSVLLLVGFIYYPLHRQKDYMFTFFVFNLVIFIICLLLGASRIQMGFAFGLFALFSILRYRTILIPVKEMGYFFVCVAMGIFNALVSEENHFVILLCADGLLLAAVFILDRYVTLNHETSKEIIYERIDLIKPVNRPEMLDQTRLSPETLRWEGSMRIQLT